MNESEGAPDWIFQITDVKQSGGGPIASGEENGWGGPVGIASEIMSSFRQQLLAIALTAHAAEKLIVEAHAAGASPEILADRLGVTVDGMRKLIDGSQKLFPDYL